MRREHARLLADAGFAAVSLENNHAHDFGDAAFAELGAELRELGVVPVTAEGSPVVIEVGPASHRARWALIALDLTSEDASERQRSLERARLQVGRASAEAEHVAVLVRAGVEGAAQATLGQRHIAALLMQWGAEIVLGSHPHVVQEFALSESGVAAFSLGNHLFDGADSLTWTGAAVTCCTRGGEMACEAGATERHRTSTFPRWIGTPLAPRCLLPARKVDSRWRVHHGRDQFVYVQPFKSAGDGAFFALLRRFSSFDSEQALRPYVFRIESRRVVDMWRGTALAFPLVAARLIEVHGEEFLCALHRGDSFLERRPETIERRRVVYRWTGFGFRGANDADARAICDAL